MAETGQFAVLWRGIAEKFKLDVDFLPGDWRHGADLEQIEAQLAADRAAQDQGGDGRPQRDLDRLRHPSARGPQGASTAPSTRRC